MTMTLYTIKKYTHQNRHTYPVLFAHGKYFAVLLRKRKGIVHCLILMPPQQ